MSNLPYTNQIPDKLINARIYKDTDGALMGTADVALPSLEYMTESLTGLGIAGELDTPVIGHFKGLALKIKWNTITTSAIGLLEPAAHSLDIRASIQRLDAGTGTLSDYPLKLLVKTLPKKLDIGSASPGKKMESESELECIYLKIWIDGNIVLELDKFNFICSVNGEDMLKSVRQSLGMD